MYRVNVTGLLIYLVLFGGWWLGLDVLFTLGVSWVLHTNPILFTFKTKAYRKAETEFEAEMQKALAHQLGRAANPFANFDSKTVN